MKVGLVGWLIALVVLCSTRGNAQSEDRAAVALEVRVHLVGSAYRASLEELLREWFAAQGQHVVIGKQASVALEHLLETSDQGEVRVWLVLPSDRRARLYFADPSSRRFFVRDVPLDNGLDELGREKLAQVVVASVQAFAERRVEDTPLESVKQALAESTEPAPGAEPATEASGSDSQTQKPAPPAPPRAQKDEPADEPSPWSWAAAARYHAVYRGPEGLAHGPGAAFDVWYASRVFAVGVTVAGRYELPHSVAARDLELELQTSAARFALSFATVDRQRPGWALGVGMGIDWFDFRPSAPTAGVVVREGERAQRTLAHVSLARFASFGAFRLGLLANLDIALVKSHYDVLVEGDARRELTPWQAHPSLALELAWH